MFYSHLSRGSETLADTDGAPILGSPYTEVVGADALFPSHLRHVVGVKNSLKYNGCSCFYFHDLTSCLFVSVITSLATHSVR